MTRTSDRLRLDTPAPADPAAHDRAAAVRIDRACTELRRGRALLIACDADRSEGPHALLVAAVETLDDTLLQQMQAMGHPLRLLISAERMQALGHPESRDPQALSLPPEVSLDRLQRLAAVGVGALQAANGPPEPATGFATPLAPKAPFEAPFEAPFDAAFDASDTATRAALNLAKRTRLLPALLAVELPAASAQRLAQAQVLQVDPQDLQRVAALGRHALRRVSDARVPIGASENCTVIVFRQLDGDAQHLAIVIGQPDADAPIPVRLHSACLTGDLFDSLRCDCGPQLQRAVAQLGETGGVLLYLAQEGRGTGLANKMRAYRLQDAGLDTLQADRYLGFLEDERDFTAAASMLQALGHTRIRLMTNNPQKIDALREAGIEVVDRMPLHGPVNRHNRRYVQTKQQAGHLAEGG